MATLYEPNQGAPFKISRSKIENYIRCPHCFYLDRRLGISQPPGFPFTLNSAVDALLKRECDTYREKKEPHPIAVEYKLEAIPYQPNPVELLATWRNNFQGISHHYVPTNFHVYGAIDDIWVTPEGKLIIIDYKATAKEGNITLNQEFHESYKRQLEIYAWLFQQNGYPIEGRAYFVYCNGIKDGDTFNNRLNFKTVLIEHILNTNWIEKKLTQIQECLNQDNPPKRSDKCLYCSYLNKVEASLKI